MSRDEKIAFISKITVERREFIQHLHLFDFRVKVAKYFQFVSRELLMGTFEGADEEIDRKERFDTTVEIIGCWWCD